MENTITQVVTNILREHDLEGLIFEDCNPDEYDVEADVISSFIMNNMSRNQVTKDTLIDNIQLVFLRYFGSFHSYETCANVAYHILYQLNRMGVMI